MEIYNFENLEYSNRHGMYGGMAGDKDGVKMFDDFWILKYPKSTKSMVGQQLDAYTTSPLSEYIGSHIYHILGIPVHETLLGIRNNKLVVACKDFCEQRGSLMEIRTVKNAAHKELEAKGIETFISQTGDVVNLEELLFHLENNSILKKVPDIKERFWNMYVVDVFINNNDRNNGNWGVLCIEDKNHNIIYKTAPVYDNGNSFETKMSEEKVLQLCNNEKEAQIRAIGSRTAYTLNNKIVSAKKALFLENQDLQQAIQNIVPKIETKMNEICNMILNIPEKVILKENTVISVCSNARKKLYISALKDRYKYILNPALMQIKEKQYYIKKEDIEDIDL